MVWVIQFHGAEILKVVLQDHMRRIKAQKRIVDRHGEVAGDFRLAQLRFELCGQDFIELGIQYLNGAGFRAR